MPKYIEKADIMTLPVIPLRGVVAFPSIPVSFEIDRDISKAACNAAEEGDARVLLVTQTDIDCEHPKRSDVYRIGCAARIKQTLRTPEDTIRVIAEGFARAEITGWRENNGYIVADVMAKNFELNEEPDVKIEAAMRALISSLERRVESGRVSRDVLTTAKTIRSPGILCDFIASGVLLRYQNKQLVLDEFDPVRRLALTAKLIEGETELIETEAMIHGRVRASLSEAQREHYLREQLRVIREELGDDIEDDVEEYQKKIKKIAMPKEVRKKLLKEVARLQQTQIGSPEATLLRNYLDTCLELPFDRQTADRVDIAVAEKILNEDHDGLKEVKERILEYLAVKQLSPTLRHQIICLVGPPGTGKTSIAMSIARALKRKYVRVSLGGIRDEADIRGHRKTYIGAMPGRIINALIQVKVKNPLILLDEIDKLTRDAHGDPASALLEVLDAEQNKNFRDHYIEFPFDLSNCMFICTANTLETIPKPLIDRMEIIELSAYTRSEKLSIAKNHLIPKQCKRHGLDRRRFIIREEAILEIIDYYTREAGVRNLEREIASLCRKAAREIVTQNKKSIIIKAEDIKSYLGGRKIIPEHISPVDEVGVVNGMAYTETGGDLLKIEAVVMDGTGKLELTGSLGDVMKESAKLAISYIRAHAKSLGVDPDFYKNKDIHLHVPEGAVPKDGPSAGVAILCAITSALTGRPARSDISMTGELTLTGNVLPIGGLKEKTSAAYAAGVRRILIPKDNEADLEKIDGVVRNGAQFVLMSSASDALKEVFAQRNRPLMMHITTPELPRTQALADDIPSAPVRAPYKNA